MVSATDATVPAPAPEPVTVVLTRRALPGKAAALETWLRQVTEAAAAFPGHLGAEIHRPAPPEQPDHVLIYRFATAADLARWTNSAERARWLRRAERLTEGTPVVQVLNGLDGWFALPGRQAVPPPPRWKTALVTAPVIYLLVLALSLAAGPLLDQLPLPLRTAVTTLLLVPLMTWIVMPPLTRLLRRWLFPGTVR